MFKVSNQFCPPQRNSALGNPYCKSIPKQQSEKISSRQPSSVQNFEGAESSQRLTYSHNSPFIVRTSFSSASCSSQIGNGRPLGKSDDTHNYKRLKQQNLQKSEGAKATSQQCNNMRKSHGTGNTQNLQQLPRINQESTNNDFRQSFKSIPWLQKDKEDEELPKQCRFCCWSLFLKKQK